MRRPLATTAASSMLALALVGCGSPVALLTGDSFNGHKICYLSFAEGELVVDPVAGTAIVEARPGPEGDEVTVTPVMWPPGFTGRGSWGEVEVLDESGEVVARTGSRYHIGGGYEADAWLACTGDFNPPTEIP